MPTVRNPGRAARRPVPILLAAALLAAAPSALADSGVLGVGSVALGKGGAFTAEADDSTASYWNPAGAVFAAKPRIDLSFGALPRPDSSAGEFGATDQWFLGALWVPERERSVRTERVARPFGFLLSALKPYPRVEYAASARVPDADGTLQTLTLGFRRDYQEALGGASTTLAEWTADGVRTVVSVGASIGLGFVDDSWTGTVTTGPSSTGVAVDSSRSIGTVLPLSVGALALYAPDDGPVFSLGVCCRLVHPLTNRRRLELPGPTSRWEEEDVYPAIPSREIRLGGSVLFGESARVSAELQWLSFEEPALFPGTFARRELGTRLGGEAALPLGSRDVSLAVRAGVSWNTVDPGDLPDVPCAWDVFGAHAGFGAVLFERLHIDFCACVRVPLEGKADPQVVGSASAGFAF